ncbi:MAG TPA: hypothetical protein PLQ89_18755 [Phycisphaerae bacterium]|nr:hypothetical protein [Phycisphaerae bacterium]HOM52599.1 hypothetical protein [Phycisphaerae bacterium]HOQ87750.1 hypothetical protein [Phycisphaerae bacterium]HPP27872.1 hypothetical protein [Phycisphaerae bacterium]HPU27578.1 hypothetical protein [Phycisphaerae bacterium]
MNKHTLAHHGWIILAGLLLTAVLTTAGCGKKDETPKHISIEGRVLAIDTATGQVKMLWYNEKEKREREIEGTLAPEAEILINGQTATLEDVKVDDIVAVTGRLEKHDGEPKAVAVKVHITRPTATEPAEAEPAPAPPQQ